MLILAIDTSTNILSMALVRGEKVLGTINERTKNTQSEVLMLRIERMMKACGLKPSNLGKIAVAIGPGSYTGIRVGVAAAKSLGYSLDIPVVGVSSLKIMSHAAYYRGTLVPMIDARRGTVFAGTYEHGENLIPDGHYEIDELLGKLPVGRITFLGDVAVVNKERLLEKCRHSRIIAESEFRFSKAVALARLARKESPVKNIHALIPSYLRKTEAELNAGV